VAKAIFGPVVSEARNKQGSLVFSRNHEGAYTRAWVQPSETYTSARDGVWATFGPLTLRWSANLTEAQRKAWRALAAAVTWPDKFGNPKHLSGFQLYIKLNMDLAWYVLPTLDTPPSNLLIYPPTSIAIDLNRTASHFWLTFAPSPVPADHWMQINGTAPQNAGVNFFGHLWRWFQAYAAGQTSPKDLYAAYVAKFGVPAVGKRIAIQVWLWKTTNGMNSARLVTSGITY